MNKVPIVLFDLLHHRPDRLSGSLVTIYTKEVVDTTKGPSILGFLGFQSSFSRQNRDQKRSMGLSERKTKQKIGADPRNLTWANGKSALILPVPPLHNPQPHLRARESLN